MLFRSSETADIIAAAHGLPAPLLHPGLRERNYGEAEGTSSLEFVERYGPGHDAVVPGAETVEEVRDRAIMAINEIVKVARRMTAPETPHVIAVAHGALIGTVLRHVSGGTVPAPGTRVENGSAHTLLVEQDNLTLLDYATV